MTDAIDRLAADLLLEGGVSLHPPVDLSALARHMGIDEIAQVDLLEEGRLERSSAGTRVLLRAGASAGRQRFTLAHELGHLLLAARDEPLVARRTLPDINDEERFCDRFAAALLMPACWMQPAFARQAQTLSTVRGISGSAGVSLAAAAVRANSVLGWSKAFLRWKSDGQRWRLASYAGLPAPLRGKLTTSRATSRTLDSIPRDRDCRGQLPLQTPHGPRLFESEISVSRYGRTAIGLLCVDRS